MYMKGTTKQSTETMECIEYPTPPVFSTLPRAVPELSALPRDSMVCITRRNLADSLT
jgi:hypothetical protein